MFGTRNDNCQHLGLNARIRVTIYHVDNVVRLELIAGTFVMVLYMGRF